MKEKDIIRKKNLTKISMLSIIIIIFPFHTFFLSLIQIQETTTEPDY